MRAWLMGLFGLAATAAGCSGPPAPDGAICQDVIHRLCLPTRCAAVGFTLGVGDTCEATLLTQTRCSEADFSFPDPPGRERFIECRLPLLRSGLDPEQHPGCTDVGDFLEICPDVTNFLKGAP